MKRKPISVLSMLLACMLLITGCASQPASSTSGTSSKGDSSISSSESPADDVSSDTDSSQDGASSSAESEAADSSPYHPGRRLLRHRLRDKRGRKQSDQHQLPAGGRSQCRRTCGGEIHAKVGRHRYCADSGQGVRQPVSRSSDSLRIQRPAGAENDHSRVLGRREKMGYPFCASRWLENGRTRLRPPTRPMPVCTRCPAICTVRNTLATWMFISTASSASATISAA